MRPELQRILSMPAESHLSLLEAFIEKQVRDQRTESTSNEDKHHFTLLASIINSSDDAILSKGLNGIITSWNNGAEKIFGYAPEEIIGKHISTLIPDDLRGEEIDIMSKLRSGAAIDHYETQRIRKDRQLINVSLTISPIKDDAGTVIGASKICRDITDQRKAEQQARNAEHSYREIFEKASDGIYVYELETGKLLEANTRATEITGFSKEELMQNQPETRLSGSPGFTQGHAKAILSKAMDGEPQSLEWKAKRKDGSLVWYEVNLRKASISGHDRILAFFRDISDRKEAEYAIEELNKTLEIRVHERTDQLKDANLQLQARMNEIHESQEKLSKIFKVSPVGIVITRLESGLIEEVNESFLDMLGYERMEVVGKSSTELQLMDISLRSELVEQIKKKGLMRVEVEMRRKSGQKFPVLLSSDHLTHNDTIYGIATFFDISERKKKEEDIRNLNIELESRLFQLSENSQKLSKIFEVSPVGILISNGTTGAIVDVNRSFLQMMEYRAEDVLGRTSLDMNMLDAEDRLRMIEEMKTRKVLREFEVGVRRASGNTFSALISSDFFEANGQVYTISILYDISDRKKKEEHIQSLNSELEKNLSVLESVNHELESFSYSVSHDLRAPLRAVSGYSSILEEDYSNVLDTEGKRLLATIKISASRMGHLIDDLLAFSRLGRKDIRKTSVDMTAIANSALVELEKSIPHGSTIEVGKLPEASADYALILQVFTNLISNAIKYSSRSEHPNIEINSLKSGNEVVYVIRDNGVGFDMRYAGKLFGVFQRLHSDTEFEGTGVGLAIVQRIITKHGGRVWAESEIGKGATFYFTL